MFNNKQYNNRDVSITHGELKHTKTDSGRLMFGAEDEIRLVTNLGPNTNSITEVLLVVDNYTGQILFDKARE
jgi:5-deoxy-D-glucuronate isomerase